MNINIKPLPRIAGEPEVKKELILRLDTHLIANDQAATLRQLESSLASISHSEPHIIAVALRTNYSFEFLAGRAVCSILAHVAASLPHCIWLEIASCNIDCLTPEVASFRALTRFVAGGNRLHELPEWFCSELVALKELYLEENDLATLPDNMGLLAQLEVLVIHSNRLSILPASLCSLTSLRKLRANNNSISELCTNIGNLSLLEHFNVSDNELSSLPDSFGGLVNLAEFEASNNSIACIPDDTFGNLVSLASCNLSHNALSTLPNAMHNLQRLTDLRIEANRFSHFPEQLCHIKSLESLDISNNAVPSIPDAIGELSLLSRLNVSFNPIDYVPGTLRKCPLRQLEVQDSLLASLPQIFPVPDCELTIMAQNTPLCVLPACVLQYGVYLHTTDHARFHAFSQASMHIVTDGERRMAYVSCSESFDPDAILALRSQFGAVLPLQELAYRFISYLNLEATSLPHHLAAIASASTFSFVPC